MVAGMIRILAALLGLAALAAPASAADRRYAVADFDRVIVEGPYAVQLVTGRPSSAVASGTRDALDRVNVDVQGRTLRIRRNRSAWGGAPGADSGPVRIALATRSLRSVRLIGPAQAQIEGARGLNVEFSVEGSGSLRAAGVDAETLALALTGSGRLDIIGASRSVRANAQGTGDIDATALRANAATIATTTGGAIAMTVNGPVAIAANGLGNVRILGRPICTTSGQGSAQVRCGAR
jgi:hypothetical protein